MIFPWLFRFFKIHDFSIHGTFFLDFLVFPWFPELVQRVGVKKANQMVNFFFLSWLISWKSFVTWQTSSVFATNKGEVQPAQPHRLINTFVSFERQVSYLNLLQENICHMRFICNLWWATAHRCNIRKMTMLHVPTERSKAVLLLWIICVIYVLCLSCFCVCSLLPCGYLLGKGWLLALVCGV